MIRIAVPLAASMLVLSACASDSGGDGGSTLKIGYQGPLSGANSALGINMENGVELAIEEANESGDLPFQLEYVASDDQGLPEQATAAAQALIDDEDVVAVVGPAFSGPTRAAGNLYGSANLAAVSSSATNPDLTEQGFTSFLQAVPNDSSQGFGAAEYLAEVAQAEKVFIIDDTSEYGVGLATVLEEELAAAGVETERDGVPAGTPDWTAAATAAKNSGANALYFAGYYSDAALLAKALDNVGFEGVKMTADGSNDPQFVAGAGESAEGWLATCPCTDATANESTQAFATAYEESAGQAPGTYSAESYDVTKMIIDVLADLGEGATREAVLEALRGIQYEGLTKTFSFDETGKIETTDVFLYEVRDGAFAYLGPIAEVVAQG
ncbi:branched-chain amino acid ABC transporter substrate-binding protein [Allostreptomyces psammosilenae]|uniref:Branched-chain amino acid transport system substrate-binding protein n=1 Tax=Allostreptomyces psammosilenae TaxID=1892865 RepID=A0A853A9G8_9ACTN|nr:branched-chain amino acid ABC transporter substrate-binding protein [Allostreptomyces psammosilenae]NYI07158.1 branched-chain amino acid transport system substrate-binding protein [Allostreptomyces psammosilenae]